MRLPNGKSEYDLIKKIKQKVGKKNTFRPVATLTNRRPYIYIYNIHIIYDDDDDDECDYER